MLRQILEREGIPVSLNRAYMHDPLAVCVAFSRRFVKTEAMHVRLARQGGVLRTLAEPDKQPNMEIVTSVDAPTFRAFWLERMIRG